MPAWTASNLKNHSPIQVRRKLALLALLKLLDLCGSTGPLRPLLTTARQDILQATLNSREWAQAGSSRRAAGLNYFWRTLD